MVNQNNNRSDIAFSLCDDDFKLVAYFTPKAGWLEYEIHDHKVVFRDIGGKYKNEFLRELTKIFEKESGKLLESIDNASFKEIVGGDKTEFLGYSALSGNNTFYFFRTACGIEHIVLANYEGQLIMHRQLNSKTLEKWGRIISQVKYNE
jgi:hypothetical protein